MPTLVRVPDLEDKTLVETSFNSDGELGSNRVVLVSPYTNLNQQVEKTVRGLGDYDLDIVDRIVNVNDREGKMPFRPSYIIDFRTVGSDGEVKPFFGYRVHFLNNPKDTKYFRPRDSYSQVISNLVEDSLRANYEPFGIVVPDVNGLDRDLRRIFGQGKEKEELEVLREVKHE